MKGFPNWWDATAYPSPTAYETTDKDPLDPRHAAKSWAWQFLRRNPDYQRAYDEWQRLSQGRQSPGAEAAARYGLTMMFPYTLAAPDFVPFSNSLALPQIDLRSSRCEERLALLRRNKDPRVALVFDLALPLAAQIQMAGAQLKAEKEALAERNSDRVDAPRDLEQPFRKQIRVYPKYLRIIDAKADKASGKQIAARFFEEGLYRWTEGDKYYAGQARLEKDWPAARWLRDFGFRLLAFSGSCGR